MSEIMDRFNAPIMASQSRGAAREARAEKYRLETPTPYEGMQMVVRPQRPFAVGHRSAHFDTLFANFIDLVNDPSRARLRDPDVANRMRQDLQILGCLNVRKLATIQLRREFVPANSTPGAKLVAERFSRLWKQQYRETEALNNMLDAILDGITIQEVLWKLNEDDYTLGIGRMYPCYKDRFVFSKTGQLALLTRHNVFYGDLVHPWQFVKHVYNPSGGSYRNPQDEGRIYWGQGLEDSIYPNYYFKTVVLNLYTRWLQRLSSGVLVARYPYKNPDARSVALELLEAYQEDEELAYPSGEEWDLEVKEATRAPAETYLSFIEYMDRQLSKAILGSTLIIDQGDVGSQSLGEVHERTTFGRITEFDRVGLIETINTELVPVIGALNKIPPELFPKFDMPIDETNPGSLQILEAYQLLQSLGFDVTAEMITEKTGFRTAKPGETLLAVPQAMMMGQDGSPEQSNGEGSPMSYVDLSSPEGIEKMRDVVYRASSNHLRGKQRYSLSTGGMGDPHRHVATLDSTGNGETDKGPDGHYHEVRKFRCQPSDGHSHDVMIPNGDLDRVVKALAGLK